MERDKTINLFEDKRGEYEYGWEQFSEESEYTEKKVEIRRKAGSGIDDDWEFNWSGQWLSVDSMPWQYKEDFSDMPDELLMLCFALVNNIEHELNVADNFVTHNSRQKFAGEGKASVSVIGDTPDSATA